MRTLTVELPLPSADLSSNARVHWGKRHKATRAQRYDAWYAACQAKYKAEWKGDSPITVDVEYRYDKTATGYKARDIANALSALKAAFDGLVDAGIVPDDTRKWFRLGSFRLHTTAKELQAMGKHPGVTLTITAED